MHTSLFAVKIRVNLINATKASKSGALMGSVHSTWIYVVPWYYQLKTKIESWLSRQNRRPAPAGSIFSGRLLEGRGRGFRERREHVHAPPQTKELPFQPSSRTLSEAIMKQAA